MHHTAEGMVSFGTPSWIPLSIVALRSNMDEQRIPEPASMQFSAGLAQRMWNAYVHITFRCCSSKGKRIGQNKTSITKSAEHMVCARLDLATLSVLDSRDNQLHQQTSRSD